MRRRAFFPPLKSSGLPCPTTLVKSNLLTFVDELLFVFAKILKLQKNTLNSGFLLTKNFDTMMLYHKS